jgi:hypothetical protein
MPVKRRQPKRRSVAVAPLDAWALVFASGCHFLGELEDFGIYGDEEAREAARDAWAVHGAAFMEEWASHRHHPDTPECHRVPWAFRQFGEPPRAD